MKMKCFKKLKRIVILDDYKKLSKKLAKKCEELADIIIDKMIDLDINELDDLQIKTAHSFHGISENYLIIKNFNKDEYGYHDSGSLNNCKANNKNENGSYFEGDLTCWIKYATYEESLYFLNNIKRYFKLLNNIDIKKCNEIENALKGIE